MTPTRTPPRLWFGLLSTAEVVGIAIAAAIWIALIGMLAIDTARMMGAF